MEHAAALSAAHIAARQHGPAIVALCVPPKWSRPPRCNNKCCPSSDPGLMPIPQAMAFLPAPRSATLPCATARGGSEAQRPSQMRSTPSTNHIPRGTRKRTDLCTPAIGVGAKASAAATRASATTDAVFISRHRNKSARRPRGKALNVCLFSVFASLHLLLSLVFALLHLQPVPVRSLTSRTGEPGG